MSNHITVCYVGQEKCVYGFEYFAYHLGSKLSTESFIFKINFLSAADIAMFYLETWRLQIASPEI